MFVVHNVTNHRVTLQLFPMSAPIEGTPRWKARSAVRRSVQHVAIAPHVSCDLEKFGFSEAEILAQPEVLRALRLLHLRRVDVTAGGYAVDQFEKHPVAAEPVASVVHKDVAVEGPRTKAEPAVAPQTPVEEPKPKVEVSTHASAQRERKAEPKREEEQSLKPAETTVRTPLMRSKKRK